MAIAFDNATAGGGVTAASTKTYSHTVNSNTDGILFVFISMANINDLLTSVTYAGVTMTRIAYQYNGASDQVYLYYLVAPASGANNVVITNSTTRNISSMAISYTGAKQTGQPDAFAISTPSTAASTQTITTTVVGANCWVVGASYNDTTGQTPISGVTERAFEDSRHYYSVGDSNGTVSSGGYAMRWDTTSGTGRFLQIGASFLPAEAASASKLTLLGVG